MSVPNQNYLSSFVGFDRFFEDLKSASLQKEQQTYPPHNIKSYTEDWYVIEIAVAGFRKSEIEISFHNSILLITGEQEDNEDTESVKYIHKGIATRKFTKKFHIGRHTKVTIADLYDGILTIHLQREIPEEEKPQIIKIESE